MPVAFETIPMQSSANVKWLGVDMLRLDKIHMLVIVEELAKVFNRPEWVVLPAQIDEMTPCFGSLTEKLDSQKIHLNHAPSTPRDAGTWKEENVGMARRYTSDFANITVR